MAMDFVAIDVETANSDMASICQIGIAKYSDGVLVDEWVSLINPEDYFSFANVMVHGIEEQMVTDSPKLPDVIETMLAYMSDAICVCHTHFDRVSIGRAFQKYGFGPVHSTWLDSAMVARRAWTDCANSGYGLPSLCEKIGYEFKHHDALEDAKACGEVLLAAIDESGLDLDAWIVRVRAPINPKSAEPIRREGNTEGELFGEVVVFTGSLTMPRREAADLAAMMGCQVASGVTKHTTILIVGDQDVYKLAGKDKSSKHLKAEKLISNGQRIRIIKESDFQVMIDD